MSGSNEPQGKGLSWGFWLLIATVLIVMLVGLNILMQQKNPSPFDKNSDGFIDHKEFTQAMFVIFDSLDKNHDNLIDADELAAAQKAEKVSLANAITLSFRVLDMDINKDGRISKNELTSRSATKKLFAELDKNADGLLHRNEAKASIMKFLFP